MAYKRNTAMLAPVTGDRLTAAMAGIGFNFATKALPEAEIEDVLIDASIEGMENDDLRVLAMLVTWIETHRIWINADKLIRATQKLTAIRTKAFWSSIGQSYKKDRRFARLVGLYKGPHIDVPRIGADFHISRTGEDPRFATTVLRVPSGILRDRKTDILPPAKLAKLHTAYRYRIIIGPTYRSDMWAALTLNPDLTPAQLARQTRGSFATAWQVKRDFGLVVSV